MSSKEIMTLVESQRSQIAAALPRGIAVDRVVRMVRTVLATSDVLQRCSPRSVLGAAVECAQLGLAPGITAHIVPYYDGKSKSYTATLIADYRGLMELARRSGEVRSIYADVVREGDLFRLERGLHPVLEHIPIIGSEAPIVAAYAVAHWRGDRELPQFEVLSMREIEAVKSQALSKIKNEAAKKYSPWVAHESEMIRKTAVRRLCKYLPISTENAELQRAITLDEAADRGEQRLGDVIDVEPEFAPPPAQISDEARNDLQAQIDEVAK